MRRTVLSLVAVMIAVAGPVFASGGQKGDWELGGFGGYTWTDDYRIFHPKDGPMAGARLGYFITSKVNMEVAAQRVFTKTDFDDPLVENRDVKLDALRLNLLYNFAPGSRFRPFLSAGGGRQKTNIEGYGKSTDWGWNGGAGFRVFLTPKVNFRVDGRASGARVGEPVSEKVRNVEGTAGLSVVFGGRGEAEPVPEAPPPVSNQPPQVSCTTDRSEILPGESVGVSASASDPEGEPLTYSWSTTAGHVTGTGSSATLDFTGATPPASATVTVRVSDSHGNSATSECAVSLVEPVRQAEAVSCLAGGFPRNLSRLTNVDKACLDDMAQRLKADPRARVIVIGHADSHEKSANAMAKKRADAIEDYLEQAGIESSRITTRSAGASKPLDAGSDPLAQARNRRCEVWFVPEGAKEPE